MCHVDSASEPPIEIQSILRKRRTSDGNTEMLVKFKDWPSKFNRWLTDAEVEQYQVKPPAKLQPGATKWSQAQH